MIILFSDLHLTDATERSTFDAGTFLNRLSSIINQAVKLGVKDLNIVLLGDIFEILKSRKWLGADVRPWQKCDNSHIDTVEAITRGIIEANKAFFDGMRDLAATYPDCRFDYIPGNHDRPLNTQMGVRARALLQDVLPVYEEGGEEFQPIFVDLEHRLIARHGHEWDVNNRYGDKTYPFGDAIVIELIQRLPILAGERLKMKEGEALLNFLHEVDNVRPHTLRVISQWVYGGLEDMKADHPKAYKIIDRTFRKLFSDLIKLTGRVNFETFSKNRYRRKLLAKALLHSMWLLGALRAARWISMEEAPDYYQKYARRDFLTLGESYQYILCGHTHHPVITPLDINKQPKLYINTGTWRRVHPVSYGSRKRSRSVSFGTLNEGCIVTVFSPDEQREFGLPDYDVDRSTRGT